MKEVIRTAGDVRRTLAQSIIDVRSGDLSVDKGMCVAALAKELTSSLQVEVNVAKVRIQLGESGATLGKLTTLGRLIIEDDGVPTLSGGE